MQTLKEHLNDKYSAKTKEVIIELDGFKFFHSPFGKEAEDEYFIGRSKALSRLTMILKNSKSKAGAYLVAGFRGMGKTSVVRKTIYDLNNSGGESSGKTDKPDNSTSSNAYTFIGPIRLLFLYGGIMLAIFMILNDNVKHIFIDFHAGILYSLIAISSLFLSFLAVRIILALSSLFSFYKEINSAKKESLKKEFETIEINLSQDEVTAYDVLRQITNQLVIKWREILPRRWPFASWVFRTFFSILHPNIREKNQYEKILIMLENLNYRLMAEVSSQKEMNIAPILSQGGFWGLFRKKITLFDYASKDSISYPIATAKEVESELIEIFRKIDNLRESSEREEKYPIIKYLLKPIIPQYIIVIDELDKVEPNSNLETESSTGKNGSFLNQALSDQIREREQTIAHLLANLKSFLNVAMAKFIFIGGREMFDASLADIADRDSFYSSIFHDIIYIDSFFKDNIDLNLGVTHMTEALLVSLLPSGEDNKEDPSLAWYAKHLKKEGYTEDERFKIIHLLQNFIVYLTYRSNGTPKKLRGLLEDYMVSGEYLTEEKRKRHLCINGEKSYEDKEDKNRIFLRFTVDQQYEISLTSLLYRPYIIIHSRHLKALGDKLLFSTAFIMDHIMKFHSLGFSWRNLELMHEIILVNKEASLRSFINELIAFMTNLYIQPTISGIHSFRFHSKVANEIKLISKISELSAAAFNFTLGESKLIKRHYQKKLRFLINQNKQNKDKQNYIHSVGFIHSVLGDLYSYDKEFDDAIVHYTDSIQNLRVAGGNMTKHQLILLVWNKLKLGNTLEKIRSYDTAFSVYKSLILDLPQLFKKIIDKDSNSQGPYRGLQLLSYAYPALLYLLEKHRHHGVTYINLEQNKVSFFEVIENNSNKKKNKDFTDNMRIAFLKSDYLTNVGTLVFYKNKTFYEHFNEKIEKNWITPDSVPNEVEQHNQKENTKDEWDLLTFSEGKDSSSSMDYTPSLSAYFIYRDALRELIAPLEPNLKKIFDNHVEKKFIACFEEGNSTIAYKKITCRFKNLNAITKALLLAYKKSRHLLSANNFHSLGDLFSKMGDAILGTISANNYKPITNYEVINFFIEGHMEDKSQNDLIGKMLLKIIIHFNLTSLKPNKPEDLYNMELVFLLYRMSSLFYIRAGKTYSYAMQFNKLLYVIKEHLVFITRKNDADQYIIRNIKNDIFLNPDFSEKLKTIAGKFYKAITWAADVANRPQVLKYRELLDWDDRDKNTSYLYNNLSTSLEIREVVLVVEEILLKIHVTNQSIKNSIDHLNYIPISLKFKNWNNESIKNTLGLKINNSNTESIKFCSGDQLIRDYSLKNTLLTPNSSINSKFTHMMDLKYRCEVNYFILAYYLGFRKSLFDYNEKKLEKGMANREKQGIIGDAISGIENVNKFKLYDLFGKELIVFLVKEKLIQVRNYYSEIKNTVQDQDQYTKPIKALENHIENAHKFTASNLNDLKNILNEYILKPSSKMKGNLTAIGLLLKKKHAWSIIEFKCIGEIDQLKECYSNCKSNDPEIEKQYEKMTKILKKHINNRDTLNYQDLIDLGNELKNRDWSNPEKNPEIEDKLIAIVISLKKIENKKIAEFNWQTVEYLVFDSIFCLFDVIKTLKLFGINYSTNHSYIANIYFKLGNWCKAYNCLVEIAKDNESGLVPKRDYIPSHKDLAKRMKEHLGTDISHYFEPRYHNELAIQHYYSALQMHHEGKAYKDCIGTLYYLNNDYQDNLYHFSAALERYKVNVGLIRGKINKLNKSTNDSRIYEHDSYILKDLDVK